jgi:hypothetical protein
MLSLATCYDDKRAPDDWSTALRLSTIRVRARMRARLGPRWAGPRFALAELLTGGAMIGTFAETDRFPKVSAFLHYVAT